MNLVVILLLVVSVMQCLTMSIPHIETKSWIRTETEDRNSRFRRVSPHFPMCDARIRICSLFVKIKLRFLDIRFTAWHTILVLRFFSGLVRIGFTDTKFYSFNLRHLWPVRSETPV